MDDIDCKETHFSLLFLYFCVTEGRNDPMFASHAIPKTIIIIIKAGNFQIFSFYYSNKYKNFAL